MLWSVAGAVEALPSEDCILTPEAEAAAAAKAKQISLAGALRVHVAAAAAGDDGVQGDAKYGVLEDGDVPGGKALLEHLQGSAVGEEVAAVAGAAVRSAVDGLWAAMKKKEYGEEERETRKRRRNDKKVKAK
eukprot:TRINITY_DN6350_c0_g1_i2.p1 TRINITY_DN6350_c0_g1~~TRINITY_DN6350_c0_g1_i2.p1  ORF type:complete len:132 (-),score=26.97 TRINITY_DN6350_c0_g1_i2:94-489(-)